MFKFHKRTLLFFFTSFYLFIYFYIFSFYLKKEEEINQSEVAVGWESSLFSTSISYCCLNTLDTFFSTDNLFVQS
jgi:hypothetical protein